MTEIEKLEAELLAAERRVAHLSTALREARIAAAVDGRETVEVSLGAFILGFLGWPTRQERHWKRLSPRSRDLIRALDPEAVPASDRR